MLCYKFGYSLEYVLSLTIPQITILEHGLAKILRAEAGKDEDGAESGAEANTLALEGVVKMLIERTGRKNFTMEEIMNPEQTIEKYKKV